MGRLMFLDIIFMLLRRPIVLLWTRARNTAWLPGFKYHQGDGLSLIDQAVVPFNSEDNTNI